MKIIRGSVLFSLACLGFGGGLCATDDLDSIIDAPRSSGKTVAYLSCAKKTKKKVKKQLRSYKKVDIVAVDAKNEKPTKFTLQKKDVDLNVGGLTKIEYYNDHNAFLLNSHLPDECSYFKHTVHVNFDAIYGQEKFGHKAAEAFINFRHKGIWGKSQSFADRTGSSVDGTSIKIGDAVTGEHAHNTGKVLPWISEAWLQMTANAVFGLTTENIHSLKLGWFPFEVGRGISLGIWYGSNRELLGLYYYDKEDKFAPGINLSGELIKNKLSYDLYYAKFEERNKSLADNIDVVRTHWLDAAGIKWRGTYKDDELFAGRLKWKALSGDYGMLDLEPYILYNNAHDQYVEIEPDITKTQLGSLGLAAEYVKNRFECGAEVATNFGKEKIAAIDRNKIIIKADDTGALKEYYSHILIADPYNAGAANPAATQAPVVSAARTAAAIAVNNSAQRTNGTNISGTYWNSGVADVYKGTTYDYDTALSSNRFRSAYTNNFCGWMLVTDAAYKFEDHKVKVAATYAYASGDANPNENETNKNYKGFAGIHEGYYGKRVPSIFLLDQRMLKRPTSLTRNSDELVTDMAFTDLHLLGAGATWTPAVGGKDLSLNPNAIFFWKACNSKKVILNSARSNGWEASTTENARKFMGTELNLVAKCEILKDLTAFGNVAAFIPGGYFTDVAGVPLDGDFYIKNKLDSATYDPKNFRISDSTAYHVNIGFDYKF